MKQNHLIFVYFLLLFTQHGVIFCAENPPPRQVNLTKAEVNPPAGISKCTPEQYAALVKLAELGVAQAQYALAYRFYLGNNPTQKIDLEKAKEWILKARAQEYRPAYNLSVVIASAIKDQDLLKKSVQEAIAHGFTENYYNLGLIYEGEKEYERALASYEKALALKKDPAAKLRIADILRYKLPGKDLQRATRYFEELAQQGYPVALYELGRDYVFGVHGKVRDKRKAYEYLLRIVDNIHKLTPEVLQIIDIDDVIISLGLLMEQGFDGFPPDSRRARDFFLMNAENVRGKTHAARLIWTHKVPGDRNSAFLTLKKNALEYRDAVAILIYGLILFRSKQPEDAVKLFEQLETRDEFPMVLLQLGIVYDFGYAVDKNKEKALYFYKKILDQPIEAETRQEFLVRGYMYLFGLGVPQDVKRGIEMIEKSEELFDDVYFSTEELFPPIRNMREYLSERAREELEAAETKQKEQKLAYEGRKKKKKKSAAQTQSIQTSGAPELGIQKKTEQQDPFAITPEEWNGYFRVTDGSKVVEINPVKRTFTIEDKQRGEKLVVYGGATPKISLNSLDKLQMAPRISQRKGEGKQSRPLSKKTIQDHTFAEMLDYVIQYIGTYVPFFKDAGSVPEDSLVAHVTRINEKTGDIIETEAEYTFRATNDGWFEVYHRLLRPVQVKKEITKMCVPLEASVVA